MKNGLAGWLKRRAVAQPKAVFDRIIWLRRGLSFANNVGLLTDVPDNLPQEKGDLETYFDSVEQGYGIWKWQHYFDIYERHFAKFRGRRPGILEIGIYSGGSLEMWKDYFGPGCKVYGVDIEPSCKTYESDDVRILIGDQADRSFWLDFKRQVPQVDIIVDDGGHEVDQQVATLEGMLDHLRPGGVYLCEDIHGISNRFLSYVSGLSWNLHEAKISANVNDNKRRLFTETTNFQSAIHSIHIYPFVVVIEKRDRPVTEFIAPKHGTQWQPFL